MTLKNISWGHVYVYLTEENIFSTFKPYCGFLLVKSIIHLYSERKVFFGRMYTQPRTLERELKPIWQSWKFKEWNTKKKSSQSQGTSLTFIDKFQEDGCHADANKGQPRNMRILRCVTSFEVQLKPQNATVVARTRRKRRRDRLLLKL